MSLRCKTTFVASYPSIRSEPALKTVTVPSVSVAMMATSVAAAKMPCT